MHTCEICKFCELELFKANNIPSGPNPTLFAITDKNYGMTGELHRCTNCGYIQCVDIKNPDAFYFDLEDPQYEDSRKSRLLQARKLLQLLPKPHRNSKFLDIGSGSGILVEEAIRQGFNAIGIEPSKWLHTQAVSRNIPSVQGVFPSAKIQGDFSIITLVDVIEHVANPVTLLQNIATQLEPDGFLLVITPDVETLFPKILKHKWWHFRVAHIGYFTKKNLCMALEKSGLTPLKIGRPCWYFGLGYLLERCCSYLPQFLRLKKIEKLESIVIPLNLGDSLYIVAQKSS